MGVRVEQLDATCVITLDWPERHNALDLPDMEDVRQALVGAAADATTSVVVLTGEGSFCAGADLKRVAARASLSADEHRGLVRSSAQALVRALVDLPVPVLAAIDGPAVGLGFDLALACDARLVGPDGWCAQGWGRIGVIPGAGGELLLRLRNPSLLWKLLAEQPRLTPAAMERHGLGEAVPSGTAREAALARAGALSTSLRREVLEAYVRLHRAELRRLLPAHLEACAEIQAGLLADADLPDRINRVLPGP